MPKGKKCIVCNQGRMRRCYTRSYWKGLRFTEEYILGIETNKGSYNPQGWLCEHCGIFIPDESNYLMFSRWINTKEDQKTILNNLKEEIVNLKNELSEHQKEYIYTEEDFEIERKFMLHRFWYIKSKIGTYNYLKGLRAGNKQSNKFHKEEIKELKLTDEQILKQAKLIENKKKLGYT